MAAAVRTQKPDPTCCRSCSSVRSSSPRARARARFASAMTRDEVAAIVERPNIFAGLETSHPAVIALYRPTSIAA